MKSRSREPTAPFHASATRLQRPSLASQLFNGTAVCSKSRSVQIHRGSRVLINLAPVGRFCINLAISAIFSRPADLSIRVD
jgi:hypothetical protein